MIKNSQELAKHFVGPILKNSGFQKKGLVWNRRIGEFVDVVSLQQAKASNDEYLSITANVGVCVPEFIQIVFGSVRPFLTEADGIVRLRFGELQNDDYSELALDKWWEVSDSNLPIVGAELQNVVENKALSFFESLHNFHSIRQFLDQQRGFFSKFGLTHIYSALTYWKLNDRAACEAQLKSITSPPWSQKAKQVGKTLSLTAK